MRRLAVVFLVTISAAAAAVPLACDPPPSGPGTAWPCGPQGRQCAGHMCCLEVEICGYDGPFSTCPAGYCCYVGPYYARRLRPAEDGGTP